MPLLSREFTECHKEFTKGRSFLLESLKRFFTSQGRLTVEDQRLDQLRLHRDASIVVKNHAHTGPLLIGGTWQSDILPIELFEAELQIKHVIKEMSSLSKDSDRYKYLAYKLGIWERIFIGKYSMLKLCTNPTDINDHISDAKDMLQHYGCVWLPIGSKTHHIVATIRSSGKNEYTLAIHNCGFGSPEQRPVHIAAIAGLTRSYNTIITKVQSSELWVIAKAMLTLKTRDNSGFERLTGTAEGSFIEGIINVIGEDDTLTTAQQRAIASSLRLTSNGGRASLTNFPAHMQTATNCGVRSNEAAALHEIMHDCCEKKIMTEEEEAFLRRGGFSEVKVGASSDANVAVIAKDGSCLEILRTLVDSNLLYKDRVEIDRISLNCLKFLQQHYNVPACNTRKSIFQGIMGNSSTKKTIEKLSHQVSEYEKEVAALRAKISSLTQKNQNHCKLSTTLYDCIHEKNKAIETLQRANLPSQDSDNRRAEVLAMEQKLARLRTETVALAEEKTRRTEELGRLRAAYMESSRFMYTLVPPSWFSEEGTVDMMQEFISSPRIPHPAALDSIMSKQRCAYFESECERLRRENARLRHTCSYNPDASANENPAINNNTALNQLDLEPLDRPGDNTMLRPLDLEPLDRPGDSISLSGTRSRDRNRGRDENRSTLFQR